MHGLLRFLLRRQSLFCFSDPILNYFADAAVGALEKSASQLFQISFDLVGRG